MIFFDIGILKEITREGGMMWNR